MSAISNIEKRMAKRNHNKDKSQQKKTFIANNASIWNRIFHSRLFIRPKCFMCKDTLNQHSDIALADPWLKEYISSEKIGMTLATCFSETGNHILTQAQNDNYIHANEISYQQVILSQNPHWTEKKVIDTTLTE